MKSDLIENRQIRVFISSTFVDMALERDYLVQNVFPVLRRYCEERDVAFQELDLRWGISEEESRQGKAVDICLKEIENTQPFFIGLLGSRYGWIPNDEDREKISGNTSVFKDYPWLEEELKNGMSITEIEIQQGVLRAEKSGEEINAYFYFRSDNPRMPVDEEFKEKPGSLAEEKLKNLKAVLRKEKADRVMEYIDLESLGNLVERDFINLIDKLFPQDEIPTELERDRLNQRIYLKKLCSVYINDMESEEIIDQFLKSAAREFIVLGERGSGKSALLANWIQNRKEDRNEKIIYQFIGQGDEGDHTKILKRLIDEVKDIYKLRPVTADGAATSDEETIMDSDRQKKELENLLFRILDEGKLIIVLDGLDKLSSDEAKSFKWLPLFPDNVKFIFSSTKEKAVMDYFIGLNCPFMEVKPLSTEQRVVLIEKYLDLFGKKLYPEQISRIAGDKESENPLALKVLLDEIRVFGKFGEELDAKINYYLNADDIPELFSLMLERCENTYNQTRSNFVEEVLSFLYVAQKGLTEAEILSFAATAPLYWSQLFNGIVNHLIIRNGMVFLANQFIKDAIKKRYMSDDEAERIIRKKLISAISNPFIDIPPTRKYTEVTYQLNEQADWETLHNLLLNFKIFSFLGNDMFAKYWTALRRADGNKYFMSHYLKLSYEGRSNVKMAEIFIKLCNIAESRREYPLAVNFVDKAVQLRPGDAVCHFTRGNIYQYGIKDAAKALENYNKALEINPDYSDAFYNRGNLVSKDNKDNYESAISDYTAALKINPKDARAYNNRALTYMKRKEYKDAVNDFSEAIRCYPNFALAYLNRANTYHLMRNYDAAIGDAIEASRLDPASKTKINGFLTTVQNTKKVSDKFSFLTLIYVFILMAGVSFAADRIGDSWLYSVAIIVNIACFVWLLKTVIVALVKRFKPGNLFFLIFSILRIVSIPLDIGLSVYFINRREAGNPVSIFMQNPFKVLWNNITDTNEKGE